jgi:ubiquinone/menaquinone biosynthesis C-methylase UbiE
METQPEEIKKWEDLEVERSASEAQRKAESDLLIKDDVIERYKNPPADTPFALEYAYHLLGDVSGKTVLDYGCGLGENSVLIASHGGKPIGIDISPELIELAEKRLTLHGFKDVSEFRVGSAHELPLDDESVDVVYGMAILHHLDLDIASREVFRVLKKGGKAIFLEPSRNSKLLGFLRGLIPYEQPDISPYERPLSDKELKGFGKQFTDFSSKGFYLPFVNLIRVVGLSEKILFPAIRIDGAILKSMNFLNHISTVRVIQMTKP